MGLPDSRVVGAIAIAIARPGSNALLIGRDNRREGFTTIADAVAGDRVLAVEVAEDVLAVDVDEADSSVPVATLAARVRSHGIEPVIVESGTPGHLHLFARVPNPSLLRRLEREAKALGLDVRRWIRPPGSRHRHSGHGRVIDPPTLDDALSRLERHRSHPQGRRSETRWKNLLRDGSPRGSRSEADMSIALGMANDGLTYEDFKNALLDPDNKGGERAREIAERDLHRAERYLRRAWDKAQTRMQQIPPITDRAEAGAVIAQMRDAVRGSQWPGLAGSSNVKVLEYLVGVATRVLSLEIHVSHRQLGEGAGIARETAGKALQRLESAGWLKVVRSGSGTRGSLVRLRPPTSPCADSAEPDERHSMPTLILAAHDAFRHRGLGATSYQLYTILDEAGPLSSEALSERSGKHRSTVKRKLKELAATGLAIQLDDGSWRAVARDLDDVAEGLLVAGIGEQARRRHATERATYARARSYRGARESVVEAR